MDPTSEKGYNKSDAGCHRPHVQYAHMQGKPMLSGDLCDEVESDRQKHCYEI